MKVMARGRVGVYEPGGVYQLYIEEMRPDGLGELYIAYERLKQRLYEEGLFDERLKKPIPKYPERVGVITAPTGAAVRDIINVITRRSPMTDIVLYPAQVQGAGASDSIVKGLEYFNGTNSVDTVIAGRGGGSIEDLWAFNEEKTVRAIFNSHIPVISAVGHETDFTIADYAADMRAPTPSAAAEIAVPSKEELYNYIAALKNTLKVHINKKTEYYQMRLMSVHLKNPTDKINAYSERIEILKKNLNSAFSAEMTAKREILGRLCAKIDTLSPIAVMSRGYAIPTDNNNKIIKSAGMLKSGDEFMLRFSDGEKDCIVK